MISGPLVKYVMTAALRDRLVLSLFLMIVVGASIAVFMGASAVTEKNQFALVFASGGLRLAGVIGLILFISVYIRRAFDARDVEYLLSRPLSRASFILSHAAAFSLLAAGVAVAVAGVVGIMAWHAPGAGYFLWAFSLMVEFVIIANAALFFSMVLPGAASSSLAVLGLYVLSRLMGQILGIIGVAQPIFGFKILATAFQATSLIVPRLDLLAQTSWLVYGPGTIGWGFVALQGVAYLALLLTAALTDLTRRQF